MFVEGWTFLTFLFYIAIPLTKVIAFLGIKFSKTNIILLLHESVNIPGKFDSLNFIIIIY